MMYVSNPFETAMPFSVQPHIFRENFRNRC